MTDRHNDEPRYWCPHGRELETADAACPLCADEDAYEEPGSDWDSRCFNTRRDLDW